MSRRSRHRGRKTRWGTGCSWRCWLKSRTRRWVDEGEWRLNEAETTVYKRRKRPLFSSPSWWTNEPRIHRRAGRKNCLSRSFNRSYGIGRIFITISSNFHYDVVPKFRALTDSKCPLFRIYFRTVNGRREQGKKVIGWEMKWTVSWSDLPPLFFDIGQEQHGCFFV